MVVILLVSQNGKNKKKAQKTDFSIFLNGIRSISKRKIGGSFVV